MNEIKLIHKQVFIDQNVKEMHFKFSELLTREVYVQIVRKILAAVRHESYIRIRAMLSKGNKEKLTTEELDAMLENITDTT
jgi:hypothetical protein